MKWETLRRLFLLYAAASLVAVIAAWVLLDIERAGAVAMIAILSAVGGVRFMHMLVATRDALRRLRPIRPEDRDRRRREREERRRARAAAR
jgi:hypothetical protein